MLQLLTSKGNKSDLQLGFRFCIYILLFMNSCLIVHCSYWVEFKLPKNLSFFATRKPAVIMVVGVNGGGKTTSLGNHHRDASSIFVNSCARMTT